MLNSKSLLLVDDDRLVLATLAKGLSLQGYAVHVAESVDEAEVILAGGDKIDLALLDVSMPGRDGMELARQLSALDHIPFIFLSAYGDQKFVDQACELGALSYLVKPIDPIQMGPVITAALDRAGELKGLKKNGYDLQSALDKDRDISIAIGITMAQHQVDRKAAFELLRKNARSSRCKIEVVAKDVIAAVVKTSPV